MSTRIETDSMGEIHVDDTRYWGAQTQRSAENFKIGGDRFSRVFIQAFGLIKQAAAEVNADLGEIDRAVADLVVQAAQEVIDGKVTVEESVLRHAPFTAFCVTRDDFEDAVSGGKFSRQQAAFPVDSLRFTKYFTPVRRIDNAYGDRNLVCSCPPLEAFAIEED